MPVRFQMKRVRGWRMPPGGICVTRSSMWGNPFRVDVIGRELALDMFRDALGGSFNPTKLAHLTEAQFDTVYRELDVWRKRFKGPPIETAISTLRGHDLGCSCGLDVACHADIYLEVANR